MTDSRTTRKTRFDVVSRDVVAPAAAIFNVLADPARHPALDDSGMVLEPVDEGAHLGPITQVGQVFRMRMTMGGVNRYETDNHVFVFEPDTSIGWEVAEAGGEPLGWTWRFDLEPVEGGAPVTRVTQTYDWSQVSDAETLRTIPFPAVPRDARLETLALLAELVETP